MRRWMRTQPGVSRQGKRNCGSTPCDRQVPGASSTGSSCCQEIGPGTLNLVGMCARLKKRFGLGIRLRCADVQEAVGAGEAVDLSTETNPVRQQIALQGDGKVRGDLLDQVPRQEIDAC